MATPQETFHTYTIDWTEEKMSWAIDGNVVRTVAYNDAKGGTRFPQTPMRLRLGIWAGGDSDNAEGTIQWAGGETDYSGTPYTMYVKSVKVTNYNPSSSYTYTDNSGSYDSIKKSDAKVSESSATSTSSSESSSTGTTLTTSVSSASQSDEAATTTAGATTTGGSTATGTGAGATSEETGAAATTGGAGSSSGTSTGSAGSGSETGSSSGSGSGSVIGSSPAGGSSPSGTPSPSGSVSGASPSPSLFEGVAAPSTGTSMVLAFLGLLTAMLQL